MRDENEVRGGQGREVLTRVVVASLLVTVVVVLLLAVLLRPVIESSAENAAEDAVQTPLDRAEAQIAGLAKKVGAKPPAALTGGGGESSVRPADGRLEIGGTERLSVSEGQTLLVTDLILENPEGASGNMTLSRGETPLLKVKLDNFRDLDYHFVSPIVIGAGDELVLAADCSGGGSCTPAVFYVGSFEKE
jgi:hypothetical protein